MNDHRDILFSLLIIIIIIAGTIATYNGDLIYGLTWLICGLGLGVAWIFHLCKR